MTAPTPAPDGFTRMADRERRTDEALESSATTAALLHNIHAHLSDINTHLAALVELATKGARK